MAITQLSVFLANEPGTLYSTLCAVSGSGINIRALTVADTRDFGILRMIVSDIEKTKEVLGDNSTITQTRVIAVRMSDEAGALRDILNILRNAGINIEYIYAFTARGKDSAYVVLRVNEVDVAEKILRDNGKDTLDDNSLQEVFS